LRPAIKEVVQNSIHGNSQQAIGRPNGKRQDKRQRGRRQRGRRRRGRRQRGGRRTRPGGGHGRAADTAGRASARPRPREPRGPTLGGRGPHAKISPFLDRNHSPAAARPLAAHALPTRSAGALRHHHGHGGFFFPDLLI